ncbi:MAG: hypothetical protein U5L96_21995 [Owenweeksia sp.]|nr:hypothetical protein [Owenweeksia sp.]
MLPLPNLIQQLLFDKAFPVVPNYINIKSYRDSNMVDTSCVQRIKPLLVDSLLISQNTFNLENKNVRNQFIKLYPNPAANQLTVEIEEVRLSALEVEITEPFRETSFVRWNGLSTIVKSIKKIDLRQLPQGNTLSVLAMDTIFMKV